MTKKKVAVSSAAHPKAALRSRKRSLLKASARKAAGSADSSKSPKARARTKAAATALVAPAGDRRDLLQELREIRTLLERRQGVPASLEAASESGVDSIRRLLSDLMEQHTVWMLSRLIRIRAAAAPRTPVAGEMDRLLEELGARDFAAEAMDYVDPLIHTVVEERLAADVPEGVILETVRPGYRTGSGMVLAKAEVAVSRRV